MLIFKRKKGKISAGTIYWTESDKLFKKYSYFDAVATSSLRMFT